MGSFAQEFQFRPEELTGILDESLRRLTDRQEDVAAAMEYLVAGLATIRATALEFWVKKGLAVCGAHPVRAYIHQDPLTGRAFRKPRGYAGDAALLDLMYLHPSAQTLLNEAGEDGLRLYKYTASGRSVTAVRNRRDRLAAKIDSAARTRPPRILSVACGHLREAELASAIVEGRYSEIVALDQDAESLKTIQECWPKSHIVPKKGSLSRLLSDKNAFGSFDLIYAAGIFDYLETTLAKRLTAALFRLLNSGGELFIANFVPGGTDLAYMEAVMDWWLIYRSKEELRDLAADISREQIAGLTSYVDQFDAIAYLEIVRE